MLQACRVLSPVRGVVSFRPSVVQRITFNLNPARPLSTGCPFLQKTDMLEQLRNIKSGKKTKKPKLTSGVISVDSDGFQELKAKIIKLRAAQLDLLGERGGHEVNVENPADIIPSCLKKPYSCEKCGKGYKTKRGLAQHTREGSKCAIGSVDTSHVSTQNYSVVENLQETFNLENLNSELKSEKVSGFSEFTLNPSLEEESLMTMSSKPLELKCDDCGSTFSHKSSLKRHKLKSLTCREIRESNGEEDGLHELGQYSVEENTQEREFAKQSSPKPMKLHQCEFCQREFKTMSALGVHKHKSKKCLSQRNELEAIYAEPLNQAEAEENFSSEKSAEEVVSLEQTLKSSREVDIIEKQEILVAYFDTLVNTGRTQAALEELKFIKSNTDGKDYIESIVIYDKLLRGFARKNDFGKIQELWKDILASGLHPSMDSFISAMISFHNSDGSKNVFRTIFKQVYGDFTSAGFTVQQALNQGDFMFDDKKKFIKVVSNFVNPDILSITTKNNVSISLTADLDKVGSANLKSHLDTVLNREDLDSLLDRQLEMETSQVVKIPSISNTSNSKTEKFRDFTDSLESSWRSRVSKALFWKISSRKKLPIWLRGSTINMHQFLTCVPMEQLTDIILATARNNINSENFSLPVSSIIASLGNDVMTAYHINLKTNDGTNSFSDYLSSLSHYYDWYCSPQSGSPTHRAAIQAVTGDLTLDQSFTMWPKSVRTAVGTEMFQIMFREILIDRDIEGNVISDGKVIDKDGKLSDPSRPVNTCPAFFKVFRKRKGNMDKEELKPHPSISAVYDSNSMVDLEFPATDLPMLVPPLPWVSATTGAYLVQESKLIKVPESAASDHESLISSLPPGGLNPIVDSINQLSSVPWIVNKAVLELACNLFRDQSDKVLLSKTDLPLHPDHILPPSLSEGLQDVLADRARLTQEQADEYRNFLQQRSLHSQIKSETFSLWCSTLYRLSLASYFQDDVLWFPHNIDFRGRCYPLPPQLNHMGADMARSLLVFAKGKKLGKNGFTWLKLHCINLTGSMKRESIAARLEYADSIMPKILQSATSPLEGERWWLESDDPWQTYSACLEIKGALDHPGGPENYTCHLPLHQDGSCNGLQHYAALGRDLLGARAVNLVPADKPQDVYSEIATIVDRKREEDSQAGLEIATVLEGFVKRKVVKQTVMTTVYGVTKYGATLQIAKQLKDTEDFPVELVDTASKYLSYKTFESLNEMFTASQEIQDWFTECAWVISRDCKSNVSWVTPLGFPVIQPYSRVVHKVDKNISLDMTNMFKIGNKSNKKEVEVRINTMKNKNGFAPNFVHSLDSSHMMLTSLKLWSQGITFASVHDCFWTHASDVESMNRACRDQFIALHSSPILEKLSDHFLEKYLEVPEKPMPTGKKLKEETLAKRMEATETERRKREMLFKSLPKKGELDLGVINGSTYFFS